MKRYLLYGLAAIVIIGATVGGRWFLRKQFLEQYTVVNGYYKQALFLTGQLKRAEAMAQYEPFMESLSAFSATYDGILGSIVADAALTKDLADATAFAEAARQDVVSGDLAKAHKQLELVRPIFNEFLRRNGYSLLAVALVDFHDAMELVLAPAESQDASGVLAAIPDADTKLKEIEAIVNDAEIQAIRSALEAVRDAATAGNAAALPDLSSTLKSNFVKVYLTRG